MRLDLQNPKTVDTQPAVVDMVGSASRNLLFLVSNCRTQRRPRQEGAKLLIGAVLSHLCRIGNGDVECYPAKRRTSAMIIRYRGDGRKSCSFYVGRPSGACRVG
jgi:hypothetical protein